MNGLLAALTKLKPAKPVRWRNGDSRSRESFPVPNPGAGKSGCAAQLIAKRRAHKSAHGRMTTQGVPRSKDGNRLGLRKRQAMLAASVQEASR